MQVSSYIFQTPYSQPLQVGRPDPAMIKEQTDQAKEQLTQQQETSSALLDTKSEQEQTDLYIKSSAIYQNDENYGTTILSVKDFTTLSKATQRSQNISIYANNSSDSTPSAATVS